MDYQVEMKEIEAVSLDPLGNFETVSARRRCPLAAQNP